MIIEFTVSYATERLVLAQSTTRMFQTANINCAVLHLVVVNGHTDSQRMLNTDATKRHGLRCSTALFN